MEHDLEIHCETRESVDATLSKTKTNRGLNKCKNAQTDSMRNHIMFLLGFLERLFFHPTRKNNDVLFR